jgi:hypothetical protein
MKGRPNWAALFRLGEKKEGWSHAKTQRREGVALAAKPLSISRLFMAQDR